MDLKNALQSIIRSHEKDVLKPLYTPWGENLDKEHVWEEYPRPQMVRSNYTILNGLWNYCILPKEKAIAHNSSAPTLLSPEENPFLQGKSAGQILVPFSPESLLSGVNRQLQPDEYLWYERTFSLPGIPLDKRLLLHFGAIDQEAQVWINGHFACSHSGGYLPFEADITPFIKEGENAITIRVSDVSEQADFTRGKQLLKRGGIFYTAQSGIWQTVWYEWVPAQYIEKIKITPNYDHEEVFLQLFIKNTATPSDTETSMDDALILSDAYAEIFDDNNCIALQPFKSSGENVLSCTVSLPDFKVWSPETPFLYSLKLYAGADYIESYFAMRHFSIETDDNGYPCFCLNHKPYFLNGVLDQAYWPDGLYTAPCDEAFIFDIETAKKLGFNTMRKHIKVEAARWYYHCDRLGMIVWQDMVNGGTNYNPFIISYVPTAVPSSWGRMKDNHYRLFGRPSAERRQSWIAECLETMECLYNVVSIAVWGPFNEGWGQFDAADVTALMQKKDSTRLIDQASGWYDRHGGDFISHHNYFRKLKSYAVPTDEQLAAQNGASIRAFVLSEYGGYACHIPGHTSLDRIFGYRKYDTSEAFADAYHHLMEDDVRPLISQGLCGAIYTQLTDIEEEVNGLITYDRKIVKVPLKKN